MDEIDTRMRVKVQLYFQIFLRAILLFEMRKREPNRLTAKDTFGSSKAAGSLSSNIAPDFLMDTTKREYKKPIHHCCGWP
jgi:hypothetical protein